MKRAVAQQILCVVLVGLWGAIAQTPRPTKYSIERNGIVSGEHAVFHFNGDILSVRYGSERSGLGIVTEWYVYGGGAWRAATGASLPSHLPIVHLEACDRDDSIDLKSQYFSLVRLFSPGSEIKYVGTASRSEMTAFVISSMPAPQTQTGSRLQISLIREAGNAAVVLTMDIGEARYCSAQWDEHRDGTRDLAVFTLLPEGSSVSYAFQSFAVREE